MEQERLGGMGPSPRSRPVLGRATDVTVVSLERCLRRNGPSQETECGSVDRGPAVHEEDADGRQQGDPEWTMTSADP